MSSSVTVWLDRSSVMVRDPPDLVSGTRTNNWEEEMVAGEGEADAIVGDDEELDVEEYDGEEIEEETDATVGDDEKLDVEEYDREDMEEEP